MIDNDELDIPTLSGDDRVNDRISISHSGEFINHSSKPLKKIDCYISNEIVERVRDFQYCVERKLGGSNEFGGFVKWHWDDGNVIVDDFMIPKQVVGGATVDFKSPATPGYTGVFHKHPTGCKSFSGVDDTYINSNHDLSILFEGGTFITGIVNINLPDSNARFQVKLNIVIGSRKRNEVDVDMVSSVSASNFREFHIAKAGVPFKEQVKRPSPSLPNIKKSPQSLEEFLQKPPHHESLSDDDLDIPEFLGE